MNRDEDPPPFFFNLKVRRMANDEICVGKLFTGSDCCSGFRLGSILIDNSFLIIDIVGTTRYSLYTCKYHGLQNMLIGSWDM
jgi:hypothetical protein